MSTKGKSKLEARPELTSSVSNPPPGVSARVRHPSIDAIQSNESNYNQVQSGIQSYSSSPSASSTHSLIPAIPASKTVNHPITPDLHLHDSHSFSSPFSYSKQHHKSQVYHRHTFPHFASQSLRDLQALTSLVDSRSGWYEDSRISDTELDQLTTRESRKKNNRSKANAKGLKAYYEKLNTILDGWREADEIVDSQFPAEVLKRFGDVDDEEIKRVAREGLVRGNKYKFGGGSKKSRRKRKDRLLKSGLKSNGGSEVDGNASDDEGEDDEEDEVPSQQHQHQRIDLDDNAVGTSDDEDDGLVFGTKSKKPSAASSRRGSFAKAISGWFSPSSKGKDSTSFPNQRGRKQSRDLEQGILSNHSSALNSRDVSPSKKQQPRNPNQLNYGSIGNGDSTNKAGIVRSRDLPTGEINSLEHQGVTHSDEELGSLDRKLALQRELKKEKEKRKDQVIKQYHASKQSFENGEDQPLLKDGMEVPNVAVELSRAEENERSKSRSNERRSLLDAVPGQALKQVTAEKNAQFAINSEF